MDLAFSDLVIRLTLAVIFGGFLGLERHYAGKVAGLRTHALVSLGAAVFVLISHSVIALYPNAPALDPLRMASQVVVGIGFLGAGTIILKGESLKGLTTAAALWVAAGLGIAAGYGLFSLAAVAALLALIVLSLLAPLERHLGPEELS